ncbi:MAG TPA: M56 family metallopeptidase [Rhodanobacteraceae bacterium]|nr:M56 family metallopeptidase [Rhodanobacteraceae bacterium]
MSALALAAAVVQALGWCLVHFLWQAALVGFVYALARWLLPRGNPRYLTAMLALVAMAVLPAWTFWHELRGLIQPVQLAGLLVTGATPTSVVTSAHAAEGWLATLEVALPWLVLAWGCGVALLGLQVVRQWYRLRAIVNAAEVLPVWQARAHCLGERLGLVRAVRVLASVRIATPTLVGWVRPAVVMPLAMLAAMPAEQVDLILAHELAHLRRFDHIANLFQVFLEVVFFYHPMVHWISRDARNEREVCCDELALRVSGGRRRDFVAALAGLEEFRAEHSGLALAASGGVLVERAWFAAGMVPHRQRPHAHGILAVLTLLGVSIVVGTLWRNHDARTTQVPSPPQPVASLAIPVPTLVLTGLAPRSERLAPLQLVAVSKAAPISLPQPAVRVIPRAEQIQVDNVVAADAVLPVLPTVQLAAPPTLGAALTLHDSQVPQPTKAVAPAYPQQALLDGTRGDVTVAFTLDSEGHPHDLSVVRSSPAGVFDVAALRAIGQWRFRPSGAPGRRFQQSFSFTPGRASGLDVVVARSSCQPVTGSHICRRFDAAVQGLTTRVPPTR